MRRGELVLALVRPGWKETKPVLGDVFEVAAPSVVAYFRHVGGSKVYCELIRVFRGTREQRPESFDALVEAREAFLTFYPVARTLKDGVIKRVHSSKLPERFRLFPLMRWGTLLSPSGGPWKWRLFDGKDYGAFQELPPDLAKLSVTGTSGHALLLAMIESGYRPEGET